MKYRRIVLIAAYLLVCTSKVCGANFALSGFGTIGYSVSDSDLTYDRFIKSQGGLRRDSVLGLQLDGKATNSVGYTLQAVSGPSNNSDSAFKPSITWAFLSWRQSDDWLIRIGKQRIPLYTLSQAKDVGVTYDFARLPIEMYSLSPSDDSAGVSVVRTWESAEGEWSLESLLGKTRVDSRVWHRDSISGVQSPYAAYRRLEAKGIAVALTYQSDREAYRAGYYRAVLSGRGGSTIGVSFPFVEVAPGIGYFQAFDSLPGPGVPQVKSIIFSVVSLGGRRTLSGDFEIAGEFARSLGGKSDFSETATRGYVSLLARRGKWAPYLNLSYVRSGGAQLRLNRLINSNTVPDFIPGSALINASQRFAAEEIRVQDQSTVAIGTAYSISMREKLKAELSMVKIGETSSLVDGPPNGDVSRRSFRVLTFTYNFAF